MTTKNYYKFTIISDTHISDWVEYSELNPYGVPSRLELYKTLAHDIVQYSRSHNSQFIVIAGDVADSAMTNPMVLDTIRSFLKIISEEFPVFLINGNHDLMTKSIDVSVEYKSVLTPLSDELHKVKYIPYNELLHISNSQSSTSKDLIFSTTPSNNSLSVLFHSWDPNIQVDGLPDADVFVGHGIVKGSSNYDNYIFKNTGFNSQELLSKFRLSIIGDLHQPQLFINSETPENIRVTKDTYITKEHPKVVLVPGSVPQNTFKDNPNPGLWVCEISSCDNTKDDPIVLQFKSIHTISPNTYHKFLYTDDTTLSSDKLNHYRYDVKVSKSTSESTSKKEHNSDILSIIINYINTNLPDKSLEYKSFLIKDLITTYESLNMSISKMISKCNFIRLEVSNFLSIKNYTFEFNSFDKELVIVGHNGSGKSSLVEAIYYCLTGKTTKDLDISQIKSVFANQDSSVDVSLQLEVNGVEYIIRRSRLSDGRPKLVMSKVSSGVESEFNRFSVKETQEEIYKLLGLNDTEIKLLIYFSAKNTTLFNTLTKSDRISTFHKFMNIDYISQLSDLYKIKFTEINESVKNNNNQINILIQHINKLNDELLKVSATDVTHHLELDLSELNDKMAKLSDLTKDNPMIVYDEKYKSYIELNSQESQLSSRVFLLKNKLNDLSVKYKDSKKSVCPTCGSNIDNKDISTKIYKELLTTLDEKNRCERELSDLIVVTGQLRQEIDKLKISIDEYNKFMKDKFLLQNKINELDKKLHRSILEVESLKSSIISFTKEKDSLVELNANVLINYEMYEYLYKNVFSKKSGLYDKVNNYIVDEFQSIIDSLLVNYKIKVKVTSELGLECNFNGTWFTYNALSSGQSRVVDVLLMIAMNKLFCKINNLDSGVLGICIFDEILSFLDNRYIQLCKSLIDELNCSKVIIITHDNKLLDQFDTKLIVNLSNQQSVYQLI